MTVESPIELIAFPAFEKAAGAAGVFELRLRLICDSVDATAKKALKSKLSVVLEKIVRVKGKQAQVADVVVLVENIRVSEGAPASHEISA